MHTGETLIITRPQGRPALARGKCKVCGKLTQIDVSGYGACCYPYDESTDQYHRFGGKEGRQERLMQKQGVRLR